MKTRILLSSFLACAALFLYGCGDDDNVSGPDGPDAVSEVILAAFSERFPEARNVEWKTKGEYFVAEFDLPAVRADRIPDTGRNSAWFDNGGKWYMTEKNITFAMLPEAVKTAFRNSEYADWRVDDVDELRREGAATVYVIEVEGRQQQDGRDVEVEIDLYYSEDGVLVKKLVVDVEEDYDYHDFIPSQPATDITDFINEKYPGARIVEIDRENGMTEVEIIDGRTCRELLFDASDKWIHTKTEVAYAAVPDPVRQALETSDYATYRVDDVDHYETPTGNYYRFELKSINGEMKVEIDETGKILNGYNPADPGPNGGGNNGNNGNNGGMVAGDIEKFIQEKYPGARIVERDYDDGMIEVEIIHDGREKDVYFNGAKEWVRTRWDLRSNELPQAVKNAINTQYPGYRLDDAEYVETPTGDYYLVELESGNRETTVRFDANGNVLR